MPEDRRHIAVMFTDIVGYSKLMGSDEEKTIDEYNISLLFLLLKK